MASSTEPWLNQSNQYEFCSSSPFILWQKKKSKTNFEIIRMFVKSQVSPKNPTKSSDLLIPNQISLSVLHLEYR